MTDLEPGDHLEVQWGAYGYRYARVTKVTKRGSVYAQRWMVGTKEASTPRRIYLWPDGDWCIKPPGPPRPANTSVERRIPEPPDARKWFSVGQIKDDASKAK